MSCETWKDPIALNAGGNLSPTETAALERHLRDCPACRRYAKEMAASQKALRRFHERSLEDSSLARIRGGVLKSIADGRVSGRRRRPQSVVRWLALAASLTLVASVWLVKDLREPAKPRPELPAPPPPAPSAPLQAATPAPRGDTPPADDTRPAPGSDLAPAHPRSQEYRRSWTTVALGTSHKSPEASPGWVVLALSEPSPSPPLLVVPPRPETTSTPGPVLLDLTVPSAAAPGARLRRLSDRTHCTIYWLEEPADTLKEKEDATTKIL